MLQDSSDYSPASTHLSFPAREVLIAALLLFSLFVTHIPDGSGRILHWKALFLIALWIIIAQESQALNGYLRSFFTGRRQVLLSVAYGAILILPLFSLTYSSDSQYGLQKWLGLILDVLPTTIAFGFILLMWSSSRTVAFVSLCSIFGVALTALLIFHGPFTYDNVPNFYGWTHVGYGRFMGFAFLVSVFALLRTRSNLFMGLLAAASFIIAVGVILSGLRAALLGSAGSVLIYLVYGMKKKIFQRRNLLMLAGAVAAAFLVLPVLQTSTRKPFERYQSFLASSLSSEVKDAPIEGRKEAFTLSLATIQANPVLGLGLGGFNRISLENGLTGMQYPHNLILEFFVELGTPGLILCGVLLWMILAGSLRLDFGVFVLVLYALWLSMFSYPIHSQKVLWIALAYFGLSEKHARSFRESLKPTP